MLNGNIKNDIKTAIEINDKGKTLGPFMGDLGGEPCEKLGWGNGVENWSLVIFNLKMFPSFDGEKKCTPRIHPGYLYLSSYKMVQKAYYKLDNLRSNHRFTDDSFFTGEHIKSDLTVFTEENKNISFDEKCGWLASKYNTNLKAFMQNENNATLAARECGGGTLKFLNGNRRSGENHSNRNGCAMRIPLVGIFADRLSELWKIVWASIRNTHNHEHAYDAARSVAIIPFIACRGLSQKSMANYINLEFRNKYTEFVNKNDINKRDKAFGYEYRNQNHYLNFDMDNCTLQSVYNDRFKYKYTETALDTVVVALRIISVAGSFYEAWALAKSYGGDADTLQAIVCAMAAVVFGVPEEFQELTKNKLATYTNDSPEIADYANVSDNMDKQFSSRYPENISLDEQLKQTLDMINDIIKDERRDVQTIEKSIDFSYADKMDELEYFIEHPCEGFWNYRPKTVLAGFVAIPIILVFIGFYFLPTNPALVALIVIFIVDCFAFYFTSEKYIKFKMEELKNSYLSKNSLKIGLLNTEILNSKDMNTINITDSITDISNINNETTQSNEFKNLIKSIIEEWNFNLDPNKEYDKNQREYFAYEPGGEAPKFNEEAYKCYIADMKSFYQQKLDEEQDPNTKIKIQTKIQELQGLTPQQMHQDYINGEKDFYKKINEHNNATAEFKTQKKLEKLKSLTPEKIEEINKYVNLINEVAEKCGIDERINFDQEKCSEWQKNQAEKIPDLHLEGEIITTNIIN